MKHISDAMDSTGLPAACEPQQRSTSTVSYTKEEAGHVKWFFARLQAIYGAAKYRATFPDTDSEKVAMREWAPVLLAKTREELDALLWHAKGMAYEEEWAWPNVAKILQGSKVPQGGQAALSYRPASEVLPPPSGPIGADRKRKGRERLAELREGIRVAGEDKDAQGAAQADLGAWTDKWVKPGYYMRWVDTPMGRIITQTDIKHSFRGNLIEESDDLDDRLHALLEYPDRPGYVPANEETSDDQHVHV